MTTTEINPYLNHNFAPVRDEITTDTLKVIGELPANLSGMFVRNGPNPQWSPIGKYHWFDGDGMLHGVRISNGQATYCNRYVRTKGWKIEQEAGKAVWSGLLEPPQMDNPHGGYKNTANTALVWHAGQMLALNEGGAPHAIKLPDLQTIGEYTYNNQLVSAFTAHPKVDPKNGEMMFFGYSFAPPYLQYSIVSAAGEIVKTVPIDLPMGVMMHDFAITENYTIFMDLPLTFSPERAQRGEPAMMFESDVYDGLRLRPSRFGIIPRHGDNSNIRWFESSPCYVFHTLNAYEDQDEIVLVACRMSSTSVLKADDSQTDPEADIPRLHRWRFNLSTGKVQEEMLDDVSAEFPRINENLLGQATRYGYAGRMDNSPLPLFDGLIKYDLNNGKSQTHAFKQGCYGGEAVFAPSIGAKHEDDGWLITFVHDEALQKSEIVVLNAQDVTAEPVARVLIPQRVPYGFHGTWVSEEQLSKTV
ncbi:carotenoid oxygenase family protein [Nodularia spumigena CS-584]|jgi:carotenoid cleavage dioxygenase-like enzyme|uniref:Carotenoid oxygenase family protein n=1 Tax=Nodularia spumigena UHCC 0060 TaxID=3110300 RepID=A0ABU5UU87_NODSP|nr:carotenoid oxygenase family protein [Nodularia spumigena]AHJ28514.1 Lignostilbene-alpha,beta-dioxygenase [Nodularia spumigena CCY9414]EAW44608.1 Retinal pigment epithelial membrane protein [Nodularia spumigena CCY9414]MDB9381274.1 carotenoid oxygenase family protein [Nodularia spumigena CS-584]MEA5526296.1 carotenoid oxygenase family protein [Nodularia spumigena UHCC 0143]MEA5556756.1 carotenoid oxygenase family protein [Nodularia spumigena CH309]